MRALLANLAVEAGRPHRRETLAGLLWPGWPEHPARTSLSNTLSHLRTALNDAPAGPQRAVRGGPGSVEACRQALAEELGVEPGPEMGSLVVEQRGSQRR